MIESVNLGLRLFIDQHGDTWPVVAMFDHDGEECDPPEAVSAVAGTEGQWYAIDLHDFGAGHYQ